MTEESRHGCSPRSSGNGRAVRFDSTLETHAAIPLVLMLEPLFRCDLACAGCGKIQYTDHVLDTRLSPEQCWKAVDECGAPMVSIAGGEPLIRASSIRGSEFVIDGGTIPTV